MHPCPEKITLHLHMSQSLRQLSWQGEVVGQAMQAMLLVTSPVVVQVVVEGVK